MTFRTEIVEYGKSEDKRFGTIREPLSYRLRLYLFGDELILKKQYFKWCFNVHEDWDEWWISKSSLNLDWFSIMTRKFDDSKYMKELETKIFEIYYDESVKMSEDIKKEILKQSTELNKKLVDQKEITKFADKFNRRRKLENINKIK